MAINFNSNPLLQEIATRPRMPGTWEDPSIRYPSGLTNTRAGYWRQVQRDELAGERFRNLADKGGALVQGARRRGAGFAASRGMLNSSLAAAASEQALVDRLDPLAQAEARAFSEAAGQNLDSLARQRIAAEGNETQLTAADRAAAGQVQSAQMRIDAEREAQIRDQEWRSRESERDRAFTREEREGSQGFTREENERNRGLTREGWDRQAEQQRIAEERAWQRDFFQWASSNPEFFRDPAAMNGAYTFFTNLFRGRSPSGTGPKPRPAPGPDPVSIDEPAPIAGPSLEPIPTPAGGGKRAAFTPAGNRFRFGQQPTWRQRQRNF